MTEDVGSARQLVRTVYRLNLQCFCGGDDSAALLRNDDNAKSCEEQNHRVSRID